MADGKSQVGGGKTELSEEFQETLTNPRLSGNTTTSRDSGSVVAVNVKHREWDIGCGGPKRCHSSESKQQPDKLEFIDVQFARVGLGQLGGKGDGLGPGNIAKDLQGRYLKTASVEGSIRGGRKRWIPRNNVADGLFPRNRLRVENLVDSAKDRMHF